MIRFFFWLIWCKTLSVVFVVIFPYDFVSNVKKHLTVEKKLIHEVLVNIYFVLFCCLMCVFGVLFELDQKQYINRKQMDQMVVVVGFHF